MADFTFLPGHANYLRMCLLFLISPLLGMALGLYKSIPLPPHTELRKLFIFVTFTFGILVASLFLSKSGEAHSRLILLMAWGFSCFTVPLFRFWVRYKFSRFPWWGFPLVIFDRCRTGRALWHFFKQNPRYGLNPVAFLNVPEERGLAEDKLRAVSRKHPGAVALIVKSAGDAADFISMVNVSFCRILVVHAMDTIHKKFWVTPCDIGVTVGFLVQQRLHDRRRRLLKRGIDLLLCLLGAVLVLPLSALLALAIRCDSRGPVLYTQRRIGYMGKRSLFISSGQCALMQTGY